MANTNILMGVVKPKYWYSFKIGGKKFLVGALIGLLAYTTEHWNEIINHFGVQIKFILTNTTLSGAGLWLLNLLKTWLKNRK